MREVAFIKQNKSKWLEFEQAIFGKSKKNPDQLADLYIHLVNDLSYAQTFYPKSKLVVYLNYLASESFQRVYTTKKHQSNRLINFFKTEVPLLAFKNRRYLYYGFLAFFLLIFIGVISAHYDLDFVRLILGDGYVNRSIENIKEGNPVAIYKSGESWSSFLGITINNLKVGAYMYFGGVFIGIVTFLMLLNNAIMVGAFQYMFVKYDVFWESVRGIWIHGSMEIFGMVIEAGAGFMLAASILFPKTYSRVNSFKIGFKESFKLYLSTIPFTIAAGFLEGFVTRYSKEMPNVLNVVIILTTLLAIGYYYLVYPYVLNKKMKKQAQYVPAL